AARGGVGGWVAGAKGGEGGGGGRAQGGADCRIIVDPLLHRRRLSRAVSHAERAVPVPSRAPVQESRARSVAEGAGTVEGGMSGSREPDHPPRVRPMAKPHREGKMPSSRRTFMQLAGAATAVAATGWAGTPAGAQANGQFKAIKALAFDAYGTLFDVFSVTALCEQLFPGKGNQLAQIWRFKQLQYSLMRSLMGRHRNFWGLTEDGLVWASKNLQLDLTA